MTNMRHESAKARKRRTEAKPTRDALIAQARRCMICGHSPSHPSRSRPPRCSLLCCHEIANGPFRQKALDKPYAILVLCAWCNGYEVEDKAKWPEARQLALLRRMSPENYDLAAYNELIGRGPNRITEEDVNKWRS
jgi:hypothetical protein